MIRSNVQSLDTSLQWDTSSAAMKIASQMRTPRPAPLFFQQPQTFSTKKERNGTPRDRQPPRPPIKSAPPISRIFPHKTFQRAQAVSFKNSSDTSLLSVHYKESCKDLYFDQCFVIESKLGAGSFGEVFKVRSKENGKLYAVKRSRERFRGDADRKRKLEEVAKHEKLPKHPNCVGFVKAWEEKQHLYIQTDLCKYSLCNFADSNHNIPEQLIWNYVVDLLMAVKHLHDHDLVHMDIKPENIFISDNDVCQLGDFGLVIDVSGETYSDAQEGDPCYMAPELLQGQFGKPADIFSLGMTILELASDLDLPKGGDLWHSLRNGHLPDDFLKGVSGELKWIISLMLEPLPERRLTAEQLLQTPHIKKVWYRRRRTQVLHAMTSALQWVGAALYYLLVTVLMAILHPLQGLLPEKVGTPQKTSTPRHPSEWDHSFSDDEAFDEDISISNNSMGAPLNFSTSSEDSFSSNGFVVPGLPSVSSAVRRVQTTPSYRQRPLRSYTPASSGSPILTSFGSRKSSSSLLQSPLSFSHNHSHPITPHISSSFREEQPEEEEEEVAKMGIEPKNLLDAFDHASSEPDDS